MENDPPAEAQLVCAECGRQSCAGENAADEWRAYLDVDDDLPVFCPQCAEREFGDGCACRRGGGAGRTRDGYSPSQ
jgi:hypothetical protein